MMKSVPPLNDLFNMAGLNLPSYLKGEQEKALENLPKKNVEDKPCTSVEPDKPSNE